MDVNGISYKKQADLSRKLHQDMFSKQRSGDGFLDTLNDVVDGAKKATAVFTMPLVSRLI
jgi:hypothetical protein